MKSHFVFIHVYVYWRTGQESQLARRQFGPETPDKVTKKSNTLSTPWEYRAYGASKDNFIDQSALGRLCGDITSVGDLVNITSVAFTFPENFSGTYF